jgi:type I restriction enzyme, S subunit
MISVQTSLGDLCRLITDGKHGDCENQFDSGFYFLSAKDVKDGKLNYEDARQITETDFLDTHRRTQLEPNDLVISNSGTIGRMALVKSQPETSRTTFQKSVAILKPKHEKVLTSWLYYYLQFDLERLIGFAGGTAQKNLLLRDLRAFSIALPPLSAQRKIAAVLSAYDELIENSIRRIAILEEMAKAIYREWFVCFHFPGHEKVKYVDSVMGKIPEEWKPKTIGSVLDFHIGGGWGQDAANEESSNPAFVIRGTDIPNARYLRVVNCPLRYHTDSNIRSRKLIANDLVFEVSGGSKGQPVGRCLYVSDSLLDCFDGHVMCASFCKLIRPNALQLAPEILYYYLLESYTDGTIEQYEVQSTGIKNFKFTDFLDKQLIAAPPVEVQEDFVLHVRPIMNLIHVLGKKAEVLRNTLNLLLPKLISGRLEVEEIDIETEELLVEAVA